ncbi:MAG TPA: cation acetate symporter [Tepidisphaeraceae bacterium]|jgi:cation/acetate symporter|nr:cation acetate symporter [Tepidisphaeraceae bacterium]
MKYDFSLMAFLVFAFFVGIVLAISFYLGRKARSASGYYAAHGQIHWFVNGVAFAGDYLSAASFLGICGMIAFYGYDGFLYSVGFLGGWVVALFVIAEPLKRLGKFTFADALDAKFNSRGIKLAAAISTLVVSVLYLIPQMVGAGTLVQPLLGLPTTFMGMSSFAIGVLIVGIVVILIVVTAGMVSTTWVQFIKGSLLTIFCFGLTIMILHRGLTVSPNPGPPQTLTVSADKSQRFVDGKPQGHGPGEGDLHPIGTIAHLPGGVTSTGPLGPIDFITTLQNSDVYVWPKKLSKLPDGSSVTTYSPKSVKGSDLLLPGRYPLFKGVRSDHFIDKLDFISLMLALFCGTASLPHILIRYYTVKDSSAARKSTVVGIASIGFFYLLTLLLGLGAMTSGALDPSDSNMAAPLLAKSFGNLPFAVISAIAFTTVLGTVSGLIMAASGAVAHDLMTSFLKIKMDDHQKVIAGKVVAVVVGIIAMLLGVAFREFNVAFLVGWAFNVAASANLPSLIMLLFWPKTTKAGITASITIGLLGSLAWLLLTVPAYTSLYHLDASRAIAPFTQPGIVTIPLGFIVLVVVSLMSQPSRKSQGFAVAAS